MYGSKYIIFRNEYNTNKCSKCGLVRFSAMKLHIVLEALSKLTGSYQRPKGICIDSNIGTRKAWNTETLPS
ncbi:MAG: hypothetical protein RSF67_05405 [Clostridia bacterium]